jgi:CBS domain-containing protein
MKASEIMTPSPRTCTPQSSVQDAARLMQEADTGVIPVVESEGSQRLVGLVTDRDLALRVLAQGRGADARVSEAMSAEVAGVRPDDSVKEVRRLMEERQVRRIPVCDEQGRCLGIISQADLALEGDISDKAVGKTVEAISQPSQVRH